MLVDFTKPQYPDEFHLARWHSRGWNLQEMLAPERVEFYDVDWVMFGTRLSLRYNISRITGIREEILISGFDVEASKSKHCVAEKMAWASRRKTTRVEDLAYCLLGIFGINIPLLYGEGDRAFERLQFQILADTEDLTLFAWKSSEQKKLLRWDFPKIFSSTFNALLANSPSEFHETSLDRDYQYLIPRFDNSIQRLTDEPPAKRLGFCNLSAPIVPGSDATPEALVLAKYQSDTLWTFKGTDIYLCLPLASIKEIGGSSAFVKNGLPYQIELKDRESGIRVERISIRLNPESRTLQHPFALREPMPLIAFYQGDWDFPKFFDADNQYIAILLQHGSSPSSEFLILCGWYTDITTANKKTPWAVITNWEELSSALELVPDGDAEHRGSAGDFPRCRTSDGGNILCSIKFRTREWYLSPQRNVAKSKFNLFVREAFSLDVHVRSADGNHEKIVHMGFRQWTDFAKFRKFILSGSGGRAGLIDAPDA